MQIPPNLEQRRVYVQQRDDLVCSDVIENNSISVSLKREFRAGRTTVDAPNLCHRVVASHEFDRTGLLILLGLISGYYSLGQFCRRFEYEFTC